MAFVVRFKKKNTSKRGIQTVIKVDPQTDMGQAQKGDLPIYANYTTAEIEKQKKGQRGYFPKGVDQRGPGTIPNLTVRRGTGKRQ